MSRGKHNPRFGMTDARFMGMIRAALRKTWMYSHAYKECINNAKVPYEGKGKRKYSIVCAECRGHYGLAEKIAITGKNGKLRHVKAWNVDHIVDAGSLKHFEDLTGFADRLFCKTEGLQILCKLCHDRKTHK